MTIKNVISILILLVTLISCDKEEELDCSAVDCIGFPSLAFEILENGTNVFEQNIFSEEDLSFSGNTPNPAELSIQEGFLGLESTQLLIMTSFAWEETTYDFNINIGDAHVANLIVEIEDSPSGGCCGGIPLIKSLILDGEIITSPYQVLTLNFNQ
ncbi:MAG: hypothetical protein AAF039_16665 [Bacteroidota bacterium]